MNKKQENHDQAIKKLSELLELGAEVGSQLECIKKEEKVTWVLFTYFKAGKKEHYTDNGKEQEVIIPPVAMQLLSKKLLECSKKEAIMFYEVLCDCLLSLNAKLSKQSLISRQKAVDRLIRAFIKKAEERFQAHNLV